MKYIILFPLLISFIIHAQQEETPKPLSTYLSTIERHCPLDEICAQGILKTRVYIDKVIDEKASIRDIKVGLENYLSQDKLGLTSNLEILKIKTLKSLTTENQLILDLEIELATTNSKLDQPKAKRPGYFSFSWGYNRAIHSNSNAYFSTKDGDFTIHNAQGNDRPSHFKNLLDYVTPSKLSIPQYNFKFSYSPNSKFVYTAGMDHMKWVFDHTKNYKVSGDFNAKLFDERTGKELNWQEDVLNNGNVSWLRFEHTDGYNYAYLGVEFNNTLLNLKMT
jgi:hypothetical protein